MEFNPVALDIIWMLLAAFLVFLMQPGFAMLEAGMTRAKNAGNIVMKNLMDFSVGTLAFAVVGFGFMFGTNDSGWFGTDGFFLSSVNPDSEEGLVNTAFWMFQVVFAATAATIVSGAIAERTKFGAYIVFSIVITALIYPIYGSWVWGGGWLNNVGDGFIDFAGSTVVHSVGGWAALAGAIVVGPRLGKFTSKGKPVAIPGHSITLAALGVFLLWFGWFGFNAGSTLSGNDLTIATIAVTTNISAAAGVVGAMTISYVLFKRFDVTMAINGAIAGLVAITAGTANVSPGMAMIIGLIGGILVVFSVLALERIFKIDDPVGVISAHGVVGAWGTLAVGLFASAQYGGVDGLFFGGGIGQLWVQAVGVLAAFAWTFPVAFIAFKVIDKVIGMRASDEEQLRGLDLTEHGAEGYPEFTGGLSGLPGDVPLVSPAD
ncbi:MAG: ammonium transporter [Chloroflexi bacterium]|nr:ammonium transporter [Chloroflexota bacterium]